MCWNDSFKCPATIIEIDRSAAICIENRNIATTSTKNIDLKYHQVRNFFPRSTVNLRKVKTQFQVADALKKPVTVQVLDRFVNAIRLRMKN